MSDRPSAEALCRRCILILDAKMSDEETLVQLRELFDIPPRQPVELDPRGWPIFSPADGVVPLPDDGGKPFD